MNPKYYQNKHVARNNKYDDSDSDSDSDYNHEDYIEDIDVEKSEASSDDPYKVDNKKSNTREAQNDNKYSTSGGISKYDIGNSNNVMKSSYAGNNNNNNNNAKYSSIKDNKRKSSGYDPYGNINIGGYSMGAMGASQSYGMKDSYNIDIDLTKIRKENSPAIVNEATKKFLFDKNDKKEIDKDKSIGNGIGNNKQTSFEYNKETASNNNTNVEIKAKRKKRDFMDDLDEQLDAEQKKEEEEEAVVEEAHREAYKFSEDYEEQEDSYKYKEQSNSDGNANKSSDRSKENNIEFSKNESNKHDEKDEKDSTISIGRYMNNLENNYNDDNNDHDHDNDQSNDNEFSYNKFASSHENIISERKDEAIYDPKKMELYLKQTKVNQIKEESNSPSITNDHIDKSELRSNKENYDKRPLNIIHSDIEDKYNDFDNNSKVNNNNTDNEDAYGRFDNDVTSNMAESNTDHALNIVKSSLSNTDFKNMLVSSSEDIYGSHREELNSFKNKIDNVILEEKSLTKAEKSVKEKGESSSNTNTDIINKEVNHNYNSEYIQNIIAEEFKKLINSNTINNILKLSLDTPKNNITVGSPFTENPTNILPAKNEIQLRLKSYIVDSSNNFLIYSDSHNKFKKFENKKLIAYRGDEIEIYRTMQPKNCIKEMKLQMALDEERKRREYFEINYNRLKETCDESENKLRRMKKIEIENLELQKLNYDCEQKYSELESDLINLKTDYEIKVKLVEERVMLRESKSEFRKIAEMQRKYEIDLENLKSELIEKISDLTEFRNKCEMYEKENTKLSMNKISNFEINDKIKELRNENFLIHEKCNEFNTKYERLHSEKEKVERKLMEKEIEIEFDKNSGSHMSVNHKMTNNLKNNNYIDVQSVVNNKTFAKQNQLSSDLIFDQIMIERELNVQEAIIKSYAKEIEKLNDEIKLLKNITLGNIAIGTGPGYNNGINSGIRNNYNKMNLNFNKSNLASNTQSLQNNFINDNFVKDSAEEKIKLLQKFLSDPNSQSNINTIENELILFEKSSKDSNGEIDLDSYLKIFEVKLKTAMSKYELIEIFNNFPRTGNNKIRYNDLLNSLRCKNPSAFFIQPDPSYIKDIEAKMISSDNKTREMEKLIENYKNKEIDFKNKFEKLEIENRSLNERVNNLKEKDKDNSSESLLTSLMKNNLIGLNNNNVKHYSDDNNSNSQSEMKKMKEKIKYLEQSNLNNLNGFEKKLNSYDDKFNNLIKTIDEKEKIGGVMSNSIINLNSEISSLKEEKVLLLSKKSELENNFKNEISNLQDKLSKYKKNFNTLKEKFEKNEKDKEKIISTFSKNKNIDLNPSIIQNFIINTENIQEMKYKIDELEKRNKDREEHYKQLCMNSNQYQLNKETETIKKKFELEKKEYIKIITQKNSDFLIIKKEFEDIYRELEEIKANKKIR